MLNHDEIVSLDKQYIMDTYGRQQLVPSYGKNAVIYDVNGKSYIDFASGIGVNSLGVSDDSWFRAVVEQLSKVQHISNYYYSVPTAQLASKMALLSGLDKVFYCNSGAEANEGAIKTARKYSYDKYGSGRSTIITFRDSFHGRTVTTISATGQDSFHDFFFPFTEGFKYSPLNDEKTLDDMLTDDICAILAEPIQGEGGVNVMTDEFAAYLRRKCDDKDVLLIFDEVQCGIGRTGAMFAYEHFGIKPDIVTLAKGLGGGLPIGAFICAEKCSSTLGRAQHGTTFGGNPVICAGACAVIDRLTNDGFIASIVEKGRYITDKVTALKSPLIKNIRGKGLMIGFEIDGNPKEYLEYAFENGLLILTAGKNVIRLLPPLTITYEEIDRGLEIFKKIIEMEKQ